MSDRAAIRSAFADLLTGLGTTGMRVFKSRTRPLQAAELPAILIFSGDAEPIGTNLDGQDPDLIAYRLRADILVKDGVGTEDIADQILDEMRAAVFSSTGANTLGGKVASIRLLHIGEPALDDSLEKPALRLPVLFETQYST